MKKKRKKHVAILNKLLYEKERLDKYHDLNFCDINEFSKGKYHILNQFIKYINEL